jgi:hypothetical protein
MNALRRHRLIRKYADGLDALAGEGLNIGDFVPYLNTISKLAGAAGQGGQAAQAQQRPTAEQLIAQERARQERAKAEADAARTRMILYGVLGVVGLGAAGLTTYLIVRKR